MHIPFPYTPARAFGHMCVLLSLLAIPACNGQTGPAPSAGSGPAPDEVIGCGLQDRNGDLWFGTRRGGLCRYDGKASTRPLEP